MGEFVSIPDFQTEMHPFLSANVENRDLTSTIDSVCSAQPGFRSRKRN